MRAKAFVANVLLVAAPTVIVPFPLRPKDA